MASDEWVVLVEHLMNTAWVQFDTGCLWLLALESELKAAGIDVAFDPFRPGESGSFTRTVDQPVRLLVHASDLDRANAIAAEYTTEVLQDSLEDED